MSQPLTPEEVLNASRLAFALSKDTTSGRTTEKWWAIRNAAYAEFDAAIAATIEAAERTAVAKAFTDASTNLDARNKSTGVSVNWLRAEARRITEDTRA